MTSPTSPEIEQARQTLRACIARTTGWNESCEQAATHLARLLAESELPRKEALGQFCALGLSRRDAKRLMAAAQRVLRDRARASEEEQFTDATPLCPHCMESVSVYDNLCPKCGGPITAIASMLPLEHIYSTGRAYQQAAAGKSNPVALIGMWLLFGPFVFVLLLFIYLQLRSREPRLPHYEGFYAESLGLPRDILEIVLLSGWLVLNLAILWKTTARWIARRRLERAMPEAEPPEENVEEG